MTFNSGLQEHPEEVCQLLLGVCRVAGFALQPLQAQGVQTRFKSNNLLLDKEGRSLERACVRSNPWHSPQQKWALGNEMLGIYRVGLWILAGFCAGRILLLTYMSAFDFPVSKN